MALEIRDTHGRCLGVSLYPRIFHRDPDLHDRGKCKRGDFSGRKPSVPLTGISGGRGKATNTQLKEV